MNVIPVCMQQRIADEGPRSFTPRPWAEELDRITVRLRPSPVELERLVEPPTEILSPLFIGDTPSRCRIGSVSRARHCLAPALFPDFESKLADGVNICRPSDFMVTDDAGFEEEFDRIGLGITRVQGKFLQDSAQLGGKLERNERICCGRGNAITVARWNRYELRF